MKKVLFAGGGTGGHVYMAVAIAQELTRQDPSIEVLFLGTKSGLESRIVPASGFSLETIEVGGLKRVGLAQTIRTLLQVPKAIWTSLKILKKFHPEITIGVGGYASGPILLAARIKRIPAAIIEPNVLPGFANRLLSPLVQGAMVAFPETAKWFGAKSKVTGIPIREDFHSIKRRPSEDGLFRILIFGGSRGSHPINLLMIDTAPFLKDIKVSVVHQTGPNDHQIVLNAYLQSGIQAEVLKYIDDMPGQFGLTDLVISRAGASTIAEITAAGIPAILIPFPLAADDHQKKNAEALAERGAAILIEQKDTDGRSLAVRLKHLSENPEELASMSKASKELSKRDSVKEIIEFMREIAA